MRKNSVGENPKSVQSQSASCGIYFVKIWPQVNLMTRFTQSIGKIFNGLDTWWAKDSASRTTTILTQLPEIKFTDNAP